MSRTYRPHTGNLLLVILCYYIILWCLNIVIAPLLTLPLQQENRSEDNLSMVNTENINYDKELRNTTTYHRIYAENDLKSNVRIYRDGRESIPSRVLIAPTESDKNSTTPRNLQNQIHGGTLFNTTVPSSSAVLRTLTHGKSEKKVRRELSPDILKYEKDGHLSDRNLRSMAVFRSHHPKSETVLHTRHGENASSSGIATKSLIADIQELKNLEHAVEWKPPPGKPKNVSHYSKFDVDDIPSIVLSDSDRNHLYEHYQTLCLRVGTNVSADLSAGCVCIGGWLGEACSLPSFLQYSSADLERLQLRRWPRRIILAFPFSLEFAQMEAQLYELGNVVDVVLVAESNFTASGLPKPRRLLLALRKGFLSEWQHKIIYVPVCGHSDDMKKTDWTADDLPRNALSQNGLKKVKGLRGDDMFILTDADEILSWQAVVFLKVHSGYPEPVSVALQHNVYGYFWLAGSGTWRMITACSVAMLQRILGNNASTIRHLQSERLADLGIEKKIQAEYIHIGARLEHWTMGGSGHFSGWHCSWCFPPEGVAIKLLSAHHSDSPRWGDHPEKRQPHYIRTLIASGTWFDDESHWKAVRRHRISAPRLFLEHKGAYRYLIENNHTLTWLELSGTPDQHWSS